MAENETSEEKGGFSLASAIKLISLIVTIIGGIGGLILLYKDIQKPIVTIKNELALPIIVTINDTYTKRVEAESTQTISLFSVSEFPANVNWKVVRNKNKNGSPLGEEIGDEYKRVDKGTTLTVNNQIKLITYFYPVIKNNTDSKCAIILNDGLSIRYDIGTSSPHSMTNITGYYKYAANTNVTLKCGDIIYFYGDRNGKQGSPLGIGVGSGVVNLSIPLESK